MVYNKLEMGAKALTIQILREIFTSSEKIEICDISDSEKEKLSFALQHRYQFFSMETGSISLILATDLQEHELPSPREYLSNYRELDRIFDRPVAFLLPLLATSTYCRRLVKEQIPFLSRYGEMYVPQLMLRLQKDNGKIAYFRPPPAKLSPATQVVLLNQLLFHNIAGLNLRQTASLLQYSPMGIYKAKEELVACGLCEYKGTRRTSSFSFPLPSDELWEKALKVIKTPVREERYVRLDKNENTPCLLAGVSALSRHTLLADDHLPTIALYRYAKEVKSLLPVHEEDADARLQLWSYDPCKLVDASSGTVDLLSLYLSLQNDPDERIKQELHNISLPCLPTP